ncbi:diaminopimelate decarboxylase [Rubinisphaera margarita]|uniref:diaminopimelate decarboxylase n=1 Tax=Rubinisphaera margarita TaxID=2909586 RepID=UPI001EE7DC19|nr:diaminopimelate decarboxylase [Rubinisphaera margarita]MCG6155288.1 diaminopimelate decarboxylase [Rubinisphaera margarita]
MIANVEDVSTPPKSDCARRIIDRCFQQDRGVLSVSGRSIEALAEQYGTPLYVYSEDVQSSAHDRLKRAYGNRFQIFYSMKANPNPALVQSFLQRGCGLEVASAGELKTALSAGCSPNRILFAGPAKRDEELRFAASLPIREVHVESMGEARRLNRIAQELGSVVDIALRINPDASVQGGAMRMGGKPSPFGFDEEVLDEVLAEIRTLKQLRITGVHQFTGTQILDADILLKQYRKAIELARRVARTLPHPLRTIDFGGGLGIPYFEHESELDLNQLAEGLAPLIRETERDPLLKLADLVIEPGRFLVGESGIYVARVIDCKQSRGRTFVLLDGGMNHQLAASGNLGQTIKRNFPIALVNRLDAAIDTKVDIVGPLCTPLDSLARQLPFPQPRVGDLIGVFQSGAYGLTSSPTGFLSHPTPAEVLVESNSDRLISSSSKTRPL